MRLLVVVLTPCRDDCPSVCERRKPVLVKAFVAELAVERFDVRTLRWLARLNQFQRDTVRIYPLVKRAAREFGSLVGSHRLGIATEAGCTVQCPSDIQASDAMVNDHVNSLFREVVDDGQALHAPAVGKRIHHEID